MAKTAMKLKQQRKSEILHKRIQSLQNLWTSTCIFKKIWNLPCMLP